MSLLNQNISDFNLHFIMFKKATFLHDMHLLLSLKLSFFFIIVTLNFHDYQSSLLKF